MRKSKSSFIVFVTIALVAVLTFVLVGCDFTKSDTYTDDRVHNIDFVTSAMQNTDFELTSLDKNDNGFIMYGSSKIKKSQLTGIQYVGVGDVDVDVDYNVEYSQNDNVVDFSAEATEVDYFEEMSFSPDMSVEGKYDGTIFIDGQEFNVFDLESEDERFEECAVILIFGIALWKIITGVAVATVAITMVTYPEFYVKGLEGIARGMETIGKVVIGGMTYILTQATVQTLTKIKTNTDSRKYNKNYPTVLVNASNKADYPHASTDATLISKYPVKDSQAIKNFKAGVHNYTTYASDAKSIISSVWWFDKITHDLPAKIGEFPHYHSSKGYAKIGGNSVHMHSFHGASL